MAKSSKAFAKAFDDDGNGTVSGSEFLQSLEKLGLGEIPHRSKRALLEMLDANRDNEISYSEFHDFLYGKSDGGNDDDDDDDNDNDGDSDDERSSKTNNSESPFWQTHR